MSKLLHKPMQETISEGVTLVHDVNKKIQI